ncbi:MAG: uroporphyrinogen-III C-methyltransferase, partial [Pseudomonas sagittaria]|nr:uroporphyrinogen-III C-methyltransferase [Pseudomonas sagittaria]
AVLQRYFGLDTPENQALYQRLGQLAGQPVAQELPDLTPALSALQAYLAQRARAELEAAAPAGEPGAVKAAPAAAPAETAPAEAEPESESAPAPGEAAQEGGA